MKSAYAVKTKIDRSEEPATLPKSYASTASSIYSDPFGNLPASKFGYENVWFTQESLERELGLVDAFSRIYDMRLRNQLVHTRASVDTARSARIVFEMTPAASRWSARIVPMIAPFTVSTTEPGPAALLDLSLAQIQEWLGIGLQQAAEAAGISRGAVYAWRDRATNPRPATVHRVLRLHGLAASAVQVAGDAAARRWFHDGDPSPLDQLIEAKGDDEQVRGIAKRLRRELTAPTLPPVNSWLAANLDDPSEP